MLTSVTGERNAAATVEGCEATSSTLAATNAVTLSAVDNERPTVASRTSLESTAIVDWPAAVLLPQNPAQVSSQQSRQKHLLRQERARTIICRGCKEKPRGRPRRQFNLHAKGPRLKDWFPAQARIRVDIGQ